MKQDAVKQLVPQPYTLTKLASVRSGWGKDLKGRPLSFGRTTLSSYTRTSQPSEREAVNLLEFEAALLAGDPHQSVARRPQLSQRVPLCRLWARDSSSRYNGAPYACHQNFVNAETLRTGEPAIAHLRTIFGEELHD